MIGETISHYRIIEKIGEGGMGVVYKADDLRLNRPVAMKFLPVHLVKEAETKARFIHEAKATAALQHPNVTVIYDFIESGDETVIVMEYLEGETLAQKINSQNASLIQILDWAAGITEGLSVAYRKGIIHRDIKPENIMITNTGVAKIMDFGLAKLRGTATMTEPGTRIGTVDYAAPEQVMGDKGDHRSDIFSLGVVLYELLTGQRPFQGDHDAAVVYAIVNEIPKSPSFYRKDISGVLEDLVLKMLEKKKDNRYQSYDEVLDDLQELRIEMASTTAEEGMTDKNKKSSLKLQRDKKGSAYRKIKGWLRGLRFPAKRKFYIYGGAIAILILLFWVKLHWFPSSNNTINSIAVLPLENLSEDPAEEYFADGMTDALISNLAMIAALNVISRTSTMTYKNTKKTLPVIAHELNVDAIIEGSVLRSGNKVRITAQLIEGRTDRHLWARSYERNISDVLALQGEVAHAIVREIELKITPQEQMRLMNSRPIDPEAYEAYLKGRYFLDEHSAEGLRKSFRYFEEAIEKDSTYANAYAGLAESYIMLGAPGLEVLPPKEIMPKARNAAIQALKLDDMLAEAHASLGSVKITYDWDWTGAESEFKRAIELNPSFAMTYLYYSSFFTIMGRHEEANAMSQVRFHTNWIRSSVKPFFRHLIADRVSPIIQRLYETSPKSIKK
jgi:serine/threonine protein kinase